MEWRFGFAITTYVVGIDSFASRYASVLYAKAELLALLWRIYCTAFAAGVPAVSGRLQSPHSSKRPLSKLTLVDVSNQPPVVIVVADRPWNPHFHHRWHFRLLPPTPGTVCLSASPGHPHYQSSMHAWRPIYRRTFLAVNSVQCLWPERIIEHNNRATFNVSVSTLCLMEIGRKSCYKNRWR